MTRSATEVGDRRGFSSLRIVYRACGLLAAWRRRDLERAALLTAVSAFLDGMATLLVVPLVAGFDAFVKGQPLDRAVILHGPMNLRVAFTLEGLLLLVLATGAFRSLLILARERAVLGYASALANTLRHELFQAVAKASWRHTSQESMAVYQNALISQAGRVQLFAIALMTLCGAAVLIAASVAVAFLIAPVVTLAGIGLGLLMSLALVPVGRRAHQLGAELVVQEGAQTKTILDFLGSLKTVKSLNAEGDFSRQLQRTLERTQGRVLSYLSVKTTANAVAQFCMVGLGCAFFYASTRGLGAHVADTVAVLAILARIAPKFASLQTALQDVLANAAALDEVNARIEHARRSAEAPAGPTEILELGRTLSLRNVTVLRPERNGPPMLDRLDLDLPVGAITAIIGPSGAGKTTLADVLLGLIEPEPGGALRVDGSSLSGADLVGWRARVGYVPQEAVLVNGSIGENLVLGLSRRPSEQAVWAALSSANVADFVRGLPDGLDTQVGDRGGHVSGGERQRLALARALLRDPLLLVLDEATSALDWENQTLIAEAIRGLSGRTTTVTIAHRVSMIRIADYVACLEQGRVMEFGAFADLAASPSSRLSRMIASERLGHGEPGDDALAQDLS